MFVLGVSYDFSKGKNNSVDKNRIIELLGVFSEDKMLTNPHPMFSELAKELKLPDEELRMRSAKTLEHILHNYAAFNISTIDGFNHQLIRRFSHDLHLNPFFEVQQCPEKH